MNRGLGALVLLLLSSHCLLSQTPTKNGSVGIGTYTPNTNAILELSSKSKGLLIPRLTELERDLIDVSGSMATKSTGLLIYNMDTKKFDYWDGVRWVEQGESGGEIVHLPGISGPPGSVGNPNLPGLGVSIQVNDGGVFIKDTSGSWISVNGATGPQGNKGDAGKSAFEIWKEVPGNETKTETEYLAGLKGDQGDAGKSAFEIWKEVPGNETKTETEYLAGLKGDQGDAGKSAFEIWKEVPGNETKTETEYLAGLKGDQGDAGKSAFEIWKEVPGNETKTETEYLAGLKGDQGDAGKSAFEIWKEVPGNETKTETEYLAGLKGNQGDAGKSAFEIWKEVPGNETKTETEYLAGLKGDQGDAGKSAFEIWKEVPGNETKTETEYLAGLKGDQGDAGKSAFEIWKEVPGNETKTETEYLAALKGDQGDAGLLGKSEDLTGTGASGPPGSPGNPGAPGAGVTLQINDEGAYIKDSDGSWVKVSGEVEVAYGAVFPPPATPVIDLSTNIYIDKTTSILYTRNPAGNWVPLNTSASSWALGGNTATVSDFLGTTTAIPLTIKTSDTERLIVTAAGNVGVGEMNPTSGFTTATSVSSAIHSVTSAYTLTDKDYTLVTRQTAAAMITLPDANICKGRIYYIINHGTTPITFSTPVEMANGETTTELSAGVGLSGTMVFGNRALIQSDGTVWVLLEN